MSLGIQEEAKDTGKVHCLCVKGRMCGYGGAVMKNLDSAHLKKAGHSYVTLEEHKYYPGFSHRHERERACLL